MNQSFKLLDTAEYIKYFQEIAEDATFIDSFFYTYDQMQESGKTLRKGTVMVLEPYTNQITENQNDNVLAMRNGFFAIIKPYSGVKNIPVVQAECEILVYKILGRIKRDTKDFIITAPISNYKGSETPPVAPQYVGYGMEFSFHSPINRFMKFEESDWAPITLPEVNP